MPRPRSFFFFTTELQALRDEHCNLRLNSSRTDCRGRLFARYDVASSTSVRAWRCYYEDALSGDRRRFDTTKNSICHQEDCNLTLEDPSSESKSQKGVTLKQLYTCRFAYK